MNERLMATLFRVVGISDHFSDAFFSESVHTIVWEKKSPLMAKASITKDCYK